MSKTLDYDGRVTELLEVGPLLLSTVSRVKLDALMSNIRTARDLSPQEAPNPKGSGRSSESRQVKPDLAPETKVATLLTQSGGGMSLKELGVIVKILDSKTSDAQRDTLIAHLLRGMKAQRAAILGCKDTEKLTDLLKVDEIARSCLQAYKTYPFISADREIRDHLFEVNLDLHDQYMVKVDVPEDINEKIAFNRSHSLDCWDLLIASDLEHLCSEEEDEEEEEPMQPGQGSSKDQSIKKGPKKEKSGKRKTAGGGNATTQQSPAKKAKTSK